MFTLCQDQRGVVTWLTKLHHTPEESREAMRLNLRLLCCASLVHTAPATLLGVGSLFGTDMVLQQGEGGNVIWGTSTPWSSVSVSRCDGGEVTTCSTATPSAITATAVVGPTGAWEVLLQAPSLATETVATYTLSVSGTVARNPTAAPPILAFNVTYGDVILCSGQVREPRASAARVTVVH